MRNGTKGAARENDPVLAEQVETAAVVQQTAKKRAAQVTAAEDISKTTAANDGTEAFKALESILAGASPDDAAAIKSALQRWRKLDAHMPVSSRTRWR